MWPWSDRRLLIHVLHELVSTVTHSSDLTHYEGYGGYCIIHLGVDDAIIHLLQMAYYSLDRPDTIISIFFIDFFISLQHHPARITT